MPLLSHCCAGQVIKNTMNRVENNNSADLLPRGLNGSVKFNPALQKEMEERREAKKINDYPETGCGAAFTCVCVKDISEKK